MASAFKILTDAMYKKGNKSLVKHGKFQQTYKEGADELRRAPGFDTTDYDMNVAGQIKKALDEISSALTPANIKDSMKQIIEISGNYLAQNAEFNKDKGPAFQFLIKKMKQNPSNLLYTKGKISKTMGQAAKDLEEAKGLTSDHDDPNLSQKIYSQLAALVKDAPDEMKQEMNDTLDFSSKYLSQAGVDLAERGQAFDLIIKTLTDHAGKPFAPDVPTLATNFHAAQALKNAPGLSVVKGDPAAASKFRDLLHKEVDHETPMEMKDDMSEAVERAANYLSGFARDRDEAKAILLKTMKAAPTKEAVKRNETVLSYGEGAKEIEASPALTPVLPVKQIQGEITPKLDLDVAAQTPRELKGAMKGLTKDAAGEFSQKVALKSGAGGERYSVDLLSAVADSMGDKPLFKAGPYGMTFKEAADQLKVTGVLEHDPQHDAMSKDIADQFIGGAKLRLTPSTVNALSPTITKASHHLAKVGKEFGNALDELLIMMSAKGEVQLAKIQGLDHTYADAAKRVAGAPSLNNDKVDKGIYETVRSKLKALVKENPPSEKYENHMPDVIETVAKFLAQPAPESAAEKRALLATILKAKGSSIFDMEGIYKMTYHEAAAEVPKSKAGQITSPEHEEKKTELMAKIDTVIQKKSLQDMLHEHKVELAGHMADVMKGRSDAITALHGEMEKRGDTTLADYKTAKLTHGQAAEAIKGAPHFVSPGEPPGLTDKVHGKIKALNAQPTTEAGKRHLEDTQLIASKFIAGHTAKEGGFIPPPEYSVSGGANSARGGAGGAGGGPGGAGGGPGGAGGGAGGGPGGAGGGPGGFGGGPGGAGGGLGGFGGGPGGAGGGPGGAGGGPGGYGGGPGGAGGGPGGAGGGPGGAGGGPGGAGGGRVGAGGGPDGTGSGPGGAGFGPGGAGFGPGGAGGGPGGAGGGPGGAGGGPGGAGGGPGGAGGGPGGAGGGPGGSGGGPGGAGGGPGGVGGGSGGAGGGPGGAGFGPGGVGGGPGGAGGGPGGAGFGPGGVGGGPGGAGGGPGGAGFGPGGAGFGPGGVGGGPGGAGGGPGGAGFGPGGAGFGPGGVGGGPGGVGGGPGGAGSGPGGAGFGPGGAGFGPGGAGFGPGGAGFGPGGAGFGPGGAGFGPGGAGFGPGGAGFGPGGAGFGPGGAGFGPGGAGFGPGGAGFGPGGAGGGPGGAGGGPGGAGGGPGGGPGGSGGAKGGKYGAQSGDSSGWPGGPGTPEEAEERRRKIAEARKRAGGLGIADPEHDEASKILQRALKAKGNEMFYQQPQTPLTYSAAADILIQKPSPADQSVRESADTDRLAWKFEKKLGEAVQNVTPANMKDPMTDVVIESAREIAEYFVAKSYMGVAKEGLIAEMQKKGNEILYENENGATETFFYAAQRLKTDGPLKPVQPYGRVAHQLVKKLEDGIKSRSMPRKLVGTMKEHIKSTANFLSGQVTIPDEKIDAYVALLGEMEAAGDTKLVEGEIPKTHKEAANYLKQLTSYEDRIKMPNAQLQATTEGKLKGLMSNVPPAGYSSNVLGKVITEQTGLLVSYIMLEAEKTKALNFLVEKMEEIPERMLLRHGSVRKTFFDAANLLHGKTTDQLSVQNPDPVASRKIQLKLTNMVEGATPDRFKPIIDSLIEDAAAYLAVHLLRPQVIRVCKCMKSVFVQCELWCEEILRHVAKPCCTCSRHVSAQAMSELAGPSSRLQYSTSQTHAFAPGLEISVTQCPSQGATLRQPETFCPGQEPPSRCRNRPLDAYFVHTTTRFNPATKLSLFSKLQRPSKLPATSNSSSSPTAAQPSVSSNSPLPSSSSPAHSLRSQLLSFGQPIPYSEAICTDKPAASSSHPNASRNSDPRGSTDESFYTPLSDSSVSQKKPWECVDTTQQKWFQSRETMSPGSPRARQSRADSSTVRQQSSDEDSLSSLVVSTDQMSDLHAMIVSLMWNVQAWRDWLQENIDRALEDHSGVPAEQGYDDWIEFQTRVTREALQWRQYNIFSRQLALRLVARYKDKKIVSPTRATIKTKNYIECQKDMLEIIDMFSKWTLWLVVILKETELLQVSPGENTLHEICWAHFKRKVESNLEDWLYYNSHLKMCWEQKYTRVITDWVPSWSRAGPVWVMSACGAVPSGAVAAGKFDGEVTWVARTTHKSEVLPAALIPSKRCCFVYSNTGVHRYTKYQVMCNADVFWVSWRAGSGGTETRGGGGGGGGMGRRAVRVAPGVYIGRVTYHGSHLLGAVLAPHQRCHVVIYGRLVAFSCYELLVLANPNTEESTINSDERR